MFRKRKKSNPEAHSNVRTNARRNTRKVKKEPEKVSLRSRIRVVQQRVGARKLAIRKIVINVAKVAAFILMVASAIAIGRLVERHIRTSDSFATKVIKVKGIDRLEREEIVSHAGIAVGQNIFQVGAEEAKERLLEHPWIASAEVERRLPDTYSIEIKERRVRALLLLEQLYLVAEDGTVFKRLADGDPYNLPTITGVDPTEFANDRDFRVSILTSTIELLDDYIQVGLKRREPIKEIYLENDRGFSLYIGTDATYVRLGRPPFRMKLRRLRKVLDRLERNRSDAEYVYLDNVRRPDRITVRLR